MRDAERISRILELLKTLWLDMPDQRFFQLLINLGVLEDSFKMWNVDDDLLEDALRTTAGMIQNE